jgi:hypothetical protein
MRDSGRVGGGAYSPSIREGQRRLRADIIAYSIKLNDPVIGRLDRLGDVAAGFSLQAEPGIFRQIAKRAPIARQGAGT